METAKEMTLNEAMDKLKKYQFCLETTLNIGHGTAESAEVNEALKVAIKTYNEVRDFLAKAVPYF